MDKVKSKSAKIAIGKYLKDLREKKELSCYAISKDTGLTINQIHQVEDGSTSYTIDSFLKMINALDCNFLIIGENAKELDFKKIVAKIKSSSTTKK